MIVTVAALAAVAGFILGVVSERRSRRQPYEWKCPWAGCEFKVSTNVKSVYDDMLAIHRGNSHVA